MNRNTKARYAKAHKNYVRGINPTKFEVPFLSTGGQVSHYTQTITIGHLPRVHRKPKVAASGKHRENVARTVQEIAAKAA